MRAQHRDAAPDNPRTVLPVGNTKKFPPDRPHVAAARDWAASASRLSGERAYTLKLLTSELCSNALQHTWAKFGGYTVTVDLHPGRVRVAVIGGGPLGSRTPRPHPADPDVEHGRGLDLVGMLANVWGADNEHGRTRVWFEVRTDLDRGR